ncbi:hypothetical protein ABT215_37915 [Streptomyces sp900105755]|uniref:hypothetical protein n=1 Tax=Streptomyces sp. 900105755 TaxID=3154389 RepID=UPI0033248CB0
MKRPGPLLTLLAGLLLGLLTLTLDATAGTRNLSSSYQETHRETHLETPPSPTPAISTAPPSPVIAHFRDGHSEEPWIKGRVRPDGGTRPAGGHGAATVDGQQLTANPVRP